MRSSIKPLGKEAKQTVHKLENRIKDLAEILKYAEQYKANKAYHIAYKGITPIPQDKRMSK